MKTYSQAFYNQRDEATRYAAETVLSILLAHVPGITSAVDVGCGVGTWLSVLQAKGIKEIKGLDGAWVDPNLLVIPRTSFEQVDLTEVVKMPQKYDLAVSLEVAEHLPSDCAKRFVSMLTQRSDRVLFSAAVPHQGGTNHLNEQWQDYWVKLFDEEGYGVQDFIRPRIWNDGRIPVWYRQNILFFIRRPSPSNAPTDSTGSPTLMPLSLIHPDLYLQKCSSRNQPGIKKSFKLFCRSLKNYFLR